MVNMIVPMQAEHVGEVARLHSASLTGLLTQLGPVAIRASYEGLVKAAVGVHFVYVQDDAVCGFVTGALDPRAMKKASLLNNLPKTLWGVFVGVLRNPGTAQDLLKYSVGPAPTSYDPAAAEMTYLAVDARCRGRSIGRQLIEAFTDAVREMGVSSYELSVDIDNHGAISVYERLGFRRLNEYREFGISHLRYRMELQQSAG